MATYFADLTINFISQLLESGFGYMACLGHLGINRRTADNGQCLPSAFFFLSVVDLQCCVSFKCKGKRLSYTHTQFFNSFLNSLLVKIITEY